jgi:hypothetical protein
MYLGKWLEVCSPFLVTFSIEMTDSGKFRRQKHFRAFFGRIVGVCGRPAIDTRIVGGQVVVPHEFPWMVGLSFNYTW